MNVKNNKRRRNSVEKIEKIFIELLQNKEIQQITVADICKRAELNRSTFYANFIDIYDLADKLRDKLERDFGELFSVRENTRAMDSVKMFTHIKENQLFYKTYFKLGYDNKNCVLIYNADEAWKHFEDKNIAYHIEFFRSGLNAIIKMWLDNGCKESPEEMAQVLVSEYKGR